METPMPLIFVPLIMYASWMEFFAQPFHATAADIDDEHDFDHRTAATASKNHH